MRVLALTGHGPPDVLRVTWLRNKKPRPGEVLIAVRAAGVSTLDLTARVGLEPEAPRPPWGVLGCEVSGEIDSVGEGVEHFAPGQAVMASCPFGGYAELATADSRAVQPLPDGWSFEEGAAFPLSYVTAYSSLMHHGAIRAGERLLVVASAGGIGIAVMQIAKMRGAEVFAVAPAREHDGLRDLGVDHPIDCRADDIGVEVRRNTGEDRPLDMVVDWAGGRSLEQGYSLLRAGGRLVCLSAGISTRSTFLDGLLASVTQRTTLAHLGMVTSQPGSIGYPRDHLRGVRGALEALSRAYRLRPSRVAYDAKTVIGVHPLSFCRASSERDDCVAALPDGLAGGEIRPVVAETLPLERGSEAHSQLQACYHPGAVVLVL